MRRARKSNLGTGRERELVKNARNAQEEEGRRITQAKMRKHRMERKGKG